MSINYGDTNRIKLHGGTSVVGDQGAARNLIDAIWKGDSETSHREQNRHAVHNGNLVEIPDIPSIMCSRTEQT